MRKNIKKFKNKPIIKAVSTVAGEKEKKGPLKDFFDITREDTKFSMPTWEQAESEMQRIAFELLLKKSKINKTDIDLVFAGDLINQCTSSTFGLIDSNIPFLGLYGACSTYAEGLILSALAIDSEFSDRAIAITSSHFCSAERQYRFPIEYGNQRTPTSQYTVTGAAGAIVEKNDMKNNVYINEATVGIITDMGIKDSNNMGAAMAPAAADTIRRYFKTSGLSPSDFDLIVTGDLGFEGHDILLSLLKRENIDCGDNFIDCGKIIYEKQADIHAGGSGCACSALVFNTYILNLFNVNSIKDILFIGTGALLSPSSYLQKKPIPSIAHLLRITKNI